MKFEVIFGFSSGTARCEIEADSEKRAREDFADRTKQAGHLRSSSIIAFDDPPLRLKQFNALRDE